MALKLHDSFFSYPPTLPFVHHQPNHTSGWSRLTCHLSLYHSTANPASSPFTHPVKHLSPNLAAPSHCWPRWCVLLSFSSYRASPPWSCGSPRRNWSQTLSSSLRLGYSPVDQQGRYLHYWLRSRVKRKQRRRWRGFGINITLGLCNSALSKTMRISTHWGHPRVDLWCR